MDHQISVTLHFPDALRFETVTPAALAQLNQKLDKIMATLVDIQAAVTAEDTVIDSALALINGLAAQVAALAPNQAAIDALAADITAKSTALAAGVAANTPAA